MLFMVSKKENHLSALTIDVEDGLSLAMRDNFNISMSQTDRVYRTTKEILELLANKNVKATFFTLGMVADDFPDLIKEIVNEGHELGVHGYYHYPVFKLTREKFYNEVKKAKDILEQISGVEIIGHRAPAFSINDQTPWAFEVLGELGYLYDSSVMPISTGHYGIKNFSKQICRVKLQNSELIEFPISTTSLFGKSIPFSGGSYFRLLPLSFLTKSFEKETRSGPSVLYLHPYEFDVVKYPKFYHNEINNLSLQAQFKLKTNFLNRDKTMNKLDRILELFRFDTMRRVIENQGFLPQTNNG